MRALRISAFLLMVVIGWEKVDSQSVAQDIVSPPEIRVFESYDENLATLTVTQTVTVQRPVTVTLTNAAGVEIQQTIMVPEVRLNWSKYLLAEATIRTVGGEELDRKEAAKQLKKGQPVLLVAKASKFPEAFKSLFREDAIVIEVNGLGPTRDLDGVKPEKP